MGTFGGSFRIFFWLNSQISSFYNHTKGSNYARALKMAIAPEVDGRIYANTHIYNILSDNCCFHFSISNQKGDSLFSVKLGINGVNASLLDGKLLDSEIVYLDKETMGFLHLNIFLIVFVKGQ